MKSTITRTWALLLLLTVCSGCYSQGRFCLREWSLDVNRYARPAFTTSTRSHLPLNSFQTADLHWRYNVPYDFYGYHPGGGRFRDRQASLDRVVTSVRSQTHRLTDVGPLVSDEIVSDENSYMVPPPPTPDATRAQLTRPVSYVTGEDVAKNSLKGGPPSPKAPPGTWFFTGASSLAR